MIKKNFKKLVAISTVAVLALSCTACGGSSSTRTQMLDKTVKSSIYVEPIEGISDDFIRGMDVSSILVEEKSGVKYYDENGKEADVFTVMADAGVNYARIRVWNDPYDENGNGYGGGNNDVATAIELGKRATDNGMKVCIDFHYSDFWADPAKQMVPKAWEGMGVSEKSDALYKFTKDSLNQLLDAGVDVSMVQIGNETNNGMSGEKIIANVTQLMNAGSKAVREISTEREKDIQIAVHYTNISDADNISKLLYKLASFQVDYDIFAVSYYPYWHGSFENLKSVLTMVQEKYGKKTMIAETASLYTPEDGDCNGNSVDVTQLTDGYSATIQSQATTVRDVCAAAHEAGALGVFYWEGAWIPVGNEWESNSKLWETYGSGWASSYAAGYDPDDAGQYYGGCSWDNQAMFDFSGHPLESLNVFKYLKCGTTADLAVDFTVQPTVTCNVGADITLPEKIEVVYNDRKANTEESVTWNADEIAAIDTSIEGKYEINGSLADGTAVKCTLKVELLNYVLNPSFEEADTSMWNVTYNGAKNPTDFQEKGPDALTGNVSFHFWDESNMDFAIEQTITGLESGTYKYTAYFQGGDINESAEMEIYIISNGTEYTAPFTAQGYANWQDPTISDVEVTDGTVTIGARIKCNAKGWGTMDDFTLNLIK
ncbi:MAG: glycosyl hydrolase family 53 [Lachnospiraceae bacterium]|nr:glycosyl hydrolase family 53 [Lachnospiraceae bacterium]